MRKLLLSATLSLVVHACLISQGIEGSVVDMNGNPVPYSSIFIKELSRGTTSNALGAFSLPLPAGEYHIFFRSLGYTEVSKTVKVNDRFVTVEVQMPPQTYMIPEVRVSAEGEDPAYFIMRKTIGLANYHLNQVKSYNAEIYIKGTAYFDRLPRAIAKRLEIGDLRMEEGRAYMMESLNDVNFRAPDTYNMRILASQNTIPGYVESVNPMDYINTSLYQPQIETFVSPLAPNAFFYYRYSFEGSFLQGTNLVAKIKVTPKRKSQQLCEGYLYVVEDLWCLHSSDIAISTIAGTLYLQQQYANVLVDAWLPVSHKIDAEVEIAGVEASVTYVSSLEYKQVELNPNLPRSYFTPTVKEEKSDLPPPEKEPTEEAEKIKEILEKEELNDRDMAKLTRLMEKEAENAREEEKTLEIETTKFSIASDAVKNDSEFWNSIRPVPLTPTEQITLAERDSILGYNRPGPPKDSSLIRKTRKVRFRDITSGKLYQSRTRRFKIEHGGLLDFSMLGFNAVDGWQYGQQFNINYQPKWTVTYRTDLRAAYNFGRKTPDIEWNSSILYAPKIRGKVAFRLDYRSLDYNQATGIPDLTNAVYSLFLRENYSRRYEAFNMQLEHRMDLATGLVLFTTVEYNNRRELTNTSDFSFFYSNSKDYASNYPNGYTQDDPLFDNSKLLFGRIRLEYTPDYYYRLQRGRKQYSYSPWPTTYLNYRYAYPVESTGWADYQLLQGGLLQELEVGLLSTLNYRIEAGYFLDKGSLHFADYMHFKSSPLLADMIDFRETFMLLDIDPDATDRINYYRGSTSDYYIEGHARFQSSYLLLKLLPWMSERLWNESISVSYLYTPDIKNHIQLGYSLNEIGFLLDVGVFTALENWSYHGTGVRINFRF
jgi:hypothetical protein